MPKDFFKLEATFKTKDAKEYKGTYFEEKVDKFESKETLDLIEQALANQTASINDKQVDRKREYPPYLLILQIYKVISPANTRDGHLIKF